MQIRKLVRDRIPELISSEGRRPIVKIISQEELIPLLKAKLLEEIEEFWESEKEEELADVLEVIDSICSLKNLSMESLHSLKEAKKLERGSFSKGIFLEEIKE